MAIKNRSTTSFGELVKPSVLCRKILRQVKEPYMYEKGYLVGKIRGHFLPSSPASLVDVSAGYCQRAVVGE
jgi:hypothetical protein